MNASLKQNILAPIRKLSSTHQQQRLASDPYPTHTQPSSPSPDAEQDTKIDTHVCSDTDSDTEFFPGNFPQASPSQINRFTYLTSLHPKQSARRLHQHRDVVTGLILFDEALATFFSPGGHNHEDDEEYQYGEYGCLCVERAAERVLDAMVRSVREQMGREQRDFEAVINEVWKVLDGNGEETGVPSVVWEAVKRRFEREWKGGGEVVSLHEESFRRVSRRVRIARASLEGKSGRA